MSRRHSPRRLREGASAEASGPAPVSRKALQLCRQIREALSWCLGSTPHDDLLILCRVDDVEPLPGNNRMLVRIGAPPDLDPIEVNRHLNDAAKTLRMEVAYSITRKKVPELIYLVNPVGI